VADLQALLAAPRIGGHIIDPGSLVTCADAGADGTPPVAGCIVRFVQLPP
jgi:hypothetical protein